ncbi:LysE family translocator [Undibacterium sp.]|jgi:threonine/homoserine/homoserine lactone efflux protein|uniref:LysE family translocator n=1 Tax=Undibacterium sp. TaxID=1914977 RepID=UPI002BE2D648|nr:LysE family translocator [Undibacterium sp.]HTD04388.1 LysE family translocator [Undibacterium sp.]
MLGTHDLALFIVSGLLLNMVPGPDSLLIMTRSAAQGWRAGSSAALGIGTGTLVHVFAAALGLSAILATSATAFMVVKLAGAAYLLYVGAQLLFSKTKAAQTDAAERPAPRLSRRQIFLQGLMTNVLNPKVALFFLAFVPQFIRPDAACKPAAFILLGFIFNFNGMLWCHFLALSSAFAGDKIKLNSGLVKWLNRLVGGVFVSLGLKLAFGRQH